MVGHGPCVAAMGCPVRRKGCCLGTNQRAPTNVRSRHLKRDLGFVCSPSPELACAIGRHRLNFPVGVRPGRYFSPTCCRSGVLETIAMCTQTWVHTSLRLSVGRAPNVVRASASSFNDQEASQARRRTRGNTELPTIDNSRR